MVVLVAAVDDNVVSVISIFIICLRDREIRRDSQFSGSLLQCAQ